jgi:hypothetical protein
MTPTFAWNLTQERIDSLGELLYKLETLLNIAHPGGRHAEVTAKFLTDLREQCCAAGAEDPFQDMPLTPRFDEVDCIRLEAIRVREVA